MLITQQIDLFISAFLLLVIQGLVDLLSYNCSAYLVLVFVPVTTDSLFDVFYRNCPLFLTVLFVVASLVIQCAWCDLFEPFQTFVRIGSGYAQLLFIRFQLTFIPRLPQRRSHRGYRTRHIFILRIGRSQSKFPNLLHLL